MIKHLVQPDDAVIIMNWLKTRGGIAIWDCADLSDPGKTWTCPLLGEDGTPKSKQYWQMGKIIREITDPAEISVVVPKEVKRFHIALRRGAQGFKIKLTDGSTRKVHMAVKKAGKGAWYVFDYSTQEAIICIPDKEIPLPEFCSVSV